MADHSTTAIAPPAPPRPLNARVRRRAWTEPHVRFWWMIGVVLVAGAAYLLVSRYLVWREGSRLIGSGVAVQAIVLQVDDSVAKGKTEPGDKSVRLSYDYQGKAYEVKAAYLEGRRSEQFLVLGAPITIRIDPQNPERWTPRDRPAPLVQELIGGILALPVGILILLFSLWLRTRTLRTWRDAEATTGMVLNVRDTALAPRAWLVRATPANESDNRVFTAFVPSDMDVKAGATVWLLVPQSGGRALAAKWFE